MKGLRSGSNSDRGGYRIVPICLFAVALLAGCGPRAASDALFVMRTAADTGIDFENRLTDTEEFNVFTYRNYFNGGGVGIGDVNGDGLPDLYLTANQLPNRLYLNEGGFRFRDVSEQAGVVGRKAWSTGVSLVDINGDGLLDIYVCNSGKLGGVDLANELFVNLGPGGDGVPVFEERATEYGLADEGYSTHAAFLDYDRDGDLDVYVLNNSFRPAGSFGLRNIRHVRDERGGDKLYRNDDGLFVDVSEEAGIYGSEIGFGLGVTVGDVNRDGWQDIYVSNDFFERDYLYINAGDGTFSESLVDKMPHTSLSSMGADMADVNNDGHPEIYVTDMLPESDRRLKTTTIYRSWDVYQAQLRNDYHHQFMRNMLHFNNADETFSDISHISGVASTDWSWGALLADFDLDGYKDIFVANGIYKDLTNQDFIDYLGSEATITQWVGSEDRSYLRLLAEIPSEPIPNYAFRNLANLTFENVATEWGLATPSFSNGAAYGDLDNDGDLDLVVNNVNMPSFVYENVLERRANSRYVQFDLRGEGKNTLAVGTAVELYVDGERQFLEQVPQRGFQSSVDPVLTFGLGPNAVPDSAIVTWPDGKRHVLTDVAVNQRIALTWSEASTLNEGRRGTDAATLFEDVTARVELPYRHQENEFNDFDREGLLIRMFSTEGPAMAVADVDGDGLEDFHLGGAKGITGQILLQTSDGDYRTLRQQALEDDSAAEDVHSAFIDVDGDGDQDLYVVSGGSEFTPNESALQDRLYLNDGGGRLTKSNGLPTFTASGSVVAPADNDGDSDTDLFVGGRLVPGQYGLDPRSYILRNDGTGTFTDVTNIAGPDLGTIGLVTDAVWSDLNGDDLPDLVVVGEWMPVSVFLNRGDGRLANVTSEAGLEYSNGLWNSILARDLDGDGDVDLVAGNLGLNTKLRATAEEPMTLYASDFDRNGSVEQVLFYHSGGGPYPIALRGELVRQLNFLKKRYVTYADFVEQEVSDVFTEDQLAIAVARQVYTLESSAFLNDGNGRFSRTALPFAAQLAPVYGVLADDFDGDSITDLVATGNFFEVRPSIGRMDASYGVVLRGTGGGVFEPIPSTLSGFRVDGQARDMLAVTNSRLGPIIAVARNNDSLLLFRLKRSSS